jgi:hypothetical protein
MSQIPEEVAKMFHRIATEAIKEDAQKLAAQACTAAEIGLGLTLLLRLGRSPEETDKNKPVSLVLVLSGPIPEDSIASLNDFVRGLMQDVDAEGRARSRTIVQDDFTKPGTTDEP